MLGVTLHQVRLKNVISQFQTKKMSFDNFEQKKRFFSNNFFKHKVSVKHGVHLECTDDISLVAIVRQIIK